MRRASWHERQAGDPSQRSGPHWQRLPPIGRLASLGWAWAFAAHRSQVALALDLLCGLSLNAAGIEGPETGHADLLPIPAAWGQALSAPRRCMDILGGSNRMTRNDRQAAWRVCYLATCANCRRSADGVSVSGGVGRPPAMVGSASPGARVFYIFSLDRCPHCVLALAPQAHAAVFALGLRFRRRPDRIGSDRAKAWSRSVQPKLACWIWAAHANSCSLSKVQNMA
jgi:hypothetical protein